MMKGHGFSGYDNIVGLVRSICRPGRPGRSMPQQGAREMRKGFGIALGLLLTAGLAYPQQLRPPIKVASKPDEARWSAMAFTPDGVAHIVWENNSAASPNHTIEYVTYDGVKASTPLNLKNQTTGNAHFPHITVGASGLMAVVWGEEGNIWLRVFDPVKKQWLNTENVKSGSGEEEPAVAIDPANNIYVWWFSESDANVFTRSKIDGKWQETVHMDTGPRSKQGSIAAGRDGRVWAIWGEKGDDGNYKGLYRKRTASTPWTAPQHINDDGASWSHACLTVGPDGTPWIVRGDVDEAVGSDQEIWVHKLNEAGNPKTLAIPSFLQHIPRIAVDKNGVHVACAVGPGDGGWGVRYTNNVKGAFKAPQGFGASMNKLPGIAADGLGNVGVCWTSVRLGEGVDVFLTTLLPIKKRTAGAPKNPKGTLISYEASESEALYEFTWQANSANKPEDLDGYRIYRRDAGDESDELVLFVPKTSLKARYTTTQYDADAEFSVVALMKSGLESARASFGRIAMPAVPAPLSIKQEVVFDGVDGEQAVNNFTWQANPAIKTSDLSEYRVYKRSNAAAAWEFAVAAPKTALVARTLAAEYSAEAQFAVVAVLNAGFESPRNPVTSITTRTMAPPVNPRAEIVVDTTDAAKLLYRFTWEASPSNPPANLEGYRLYRKGSGTSWVSLAAVSATTLTASVPITTYNDATTFGITALHLGGVASAKAAVTVVRPALLAPANAKAVYKVSGIKSKLRLTIDFTWSANTGSDDRFVAGYRIYMKEGDGSFELFKTLAKSELSWSFIYAGAAPKLQFAITTLSSLGIESPPAVIGVTASGTRD